ncbi:MAG TPA: AAA family ATPase [Planctomycetaceae bacterium]|nr:AAA family ATPase [Planctomycetaceae bacterium]
MSLATQLAPYIRAAFSGLYVETFEPEEALREIRQLCAAEENWMVATWDIDRGLQVPPDSAMPAVSDPLAALRSLPALATPNGTALLVLKNFHRFLGSAEIIQALQHQLDAGKACRTFVVILAPTVQLPLELQRSFVVLTHALPERQQLRAMGEEIVQDRTPPTETQWAALLDAAAGLTRTEAEGAFSLSLARCDELRPRILWEWKAQSLRKQNLLSLHRGGGSFAELGGLTALKEFCRRALEPGRSVAARGALLLSPPGCGKSAFCKSLGSEIGRPVLTLDLGALYGSLLGETEKNIRQALAIADAMAPAVLFVDELDKGLSGTGGQGDSGVSTRLFGTLLTWLADHASDVFFIGTANDISRLPPEFTRAERLDGVFFVDLPSAEQRLEIWSLYRRQYDIAANQPIPPDEGWTGAEIKSCCRLSALLDVSLTEAARNVVPVSVTSAEAVDRLRTWASGRCLSADRPGIYQRPGVERPSRRKVTPPTSTN